MMHITFNGKKSTDFYLYLAGDIQHATATNDLEVVEVMGRDGAVIIPNNRLKPVDQELQFTLKIPYSVKKSVADAVRDISEWLSPTQWCEFTKSWEPDYVYKAIIVNDFSVSESLTKFGKLSLTVKLHPIKYLTSGQTIQTIHGGTTLTNPTNRIAKPYFELRGTGNVVLTIGTGQMVFKNVSGGVNVDCEKSAVWYGQTSAYGTVASENFITLPTGTFSVRLDNPAFTLRLKPNWGVKV